MFRKSLHLAIVFVTTILKPLNEVLTDNGHQVMAIHLSYKINNGQQHSCGRIQTKSIHVPLGRSGFQNLLNQDKI